MNNHLRKKSRTYGTSEIYSRGSGGVPRPREGATVVKGAKEMCQGQRGTKAQEGCRDHLASDWPRPFMWSQQSSSTPPSPRYSGWPKTENLLQRLLHIQL